MLEKDFQSNFIKELEQLFPGCVVLKNDPNYIQGFPDLLILYENRWAALECKKNELSTYRPNQKYYLEILNDMSFAAVVYPNNREEVLYALQSAFRS